MSALDRSRPARMALAFFGLLVASVLGVILGVVLSNRIQIRPLFACKSDPF